ncbi:MAG TPA: DUF559 domain-containing protein [Deinococcales bacterium]|nr:DUF559 domain-containing protein [Deinococcales bacterium]
MDAHARARTLRRSMTFTEVKFWTLVKGQALGVKFRRQHPVGSYVADFAVPSLKLIVELDGSQHFESEHDQVRDAWLQARGWRVERFSNEELLRTPLVVLERVRQAIEELGGGETPG